MHVSIVQWMHLKSHLVSIVGCVSLYSGTGLDTNSRSGPGAPCPTGNTSSTLDSHGPPAAVHIETHTY